MRKMLSAAIVAGGLLATAVASADDTTTKTTTTSANETTSTPTGTLSAPPTRETMTLYQSVRPNKAYLYTGGALFLGSYTTTAVLTGVAANDEKATVDRNLYIPVIGPWMHLADDGKTASDGTADTLLVAGSGILQGAGVAMIIASFFIPERVAVATIQAGNVKVNVTPISFARGSGVGAVGTF